MVKFHMGSKIREYAKSKGVKFTWLALKTGIERGNMNKLLARPELSVSQIKTFSKVLNHDFFQYLVDEEEDDSVVEETKAEYGKKQLVVVVKIVDEEGEHPVPQNEVTKLLDMAAKLWMEDLEKKKQKKQPVDTKKTATKKSK